VNCALRRHARNVLRPFALVAAVCLVTSFVMSGLLATAASAGSPTTASVLKTTKAAIKKQTGAHLVSSASSASTTHQVTSDLGVTSGQETSVDGSASVAIRVTPTYVYISGNSDGLTKVFGLSSSQATKVGTDWVSFKSGTSQYSELKSSLSVATLTDVLPKAKGTKLTTEVVGGATFYLLKWTSKASGSVPKLKSTLTVAASENLPVSEESSDAAGTKVTTTFSGWGEAVTVTAPPAASTIPSSDLSS
jgi:hypothetical protein